MGHPEHKDQSRVVGANGLDWRTVVGVIGRTLIAVGLLMFGFVAYQLWGTGIKTAQAQQRLSQQLDEALAKASTIPQDTLPPLTAAPPTETTLATSSTPSLGTTPTTEIVEDGASSESPIKPELGQPIARLEIEEVDVDWTVVEGVGPDQLADGPGHFPETPLPGDLGNVAIAGHRTTHGQPFFSIDRLNAGDEIILTSVDGRFVYLVTDQVIVSPDEYALIVPTTDAQSATLTLITCHPPFSTSKRLVIRATLDLTQSAPIAAHTGSVLDPVSTSTSEPAVEGTAGSIPMAAPTTSEEARVGPSDSGSALGTSPPATRPPADSSDAFSNRWFSDPSAFGQVGLWGLHLVLVSLGAYALSKRVRNDWVGGLLGAGPFLIGLYFFYENVARLLPPTI